MFLARVCAPFWRLVWIFEGKGHRNQKLDDLGSVLMHCLTAEAFGLNNVLAKKNQQENPEKPRKSKTLVQ